jgi:hypothetical protein
LVPDEETLSLSPPDGGMIDRPGILASGKSSFSVVSPVAGSSVIALPSTCPRPENSAGGS